MSTTFWIQFMGVIFGLAMMYFTFVKFKRKELTSLSLIVWFIIWMVIIAVAIVPSVLDPIIAPLHFYRRLDFFVVLGFFVLLWLGFYSYSLVRKMEQKLEQFVRTDALNQAKEKDSKADGTEKHQP